MKESILLIGDNNHEELQNNTQLLEVLMPNYQVVPVTTSDSLNVLSANETYCMCVVVDVRAVDYVNALKAIRGIRQLDVGLPVLLWIQFGEEAFASEAVKSGAHDFIVKPASSEKIMLSVRHACDMRRMRGYITRLEQHIAEQSDISADERQVIMMGQLHHLLTDENGHIRPLKSLEKDIIIAVLRYSGGCVSQAARSLGIGRSTLYRKAGEYNIQSYIRRESSMTRPINDLSLRQYSSGA